MSEDFKDFRREVRDDLRTLSAEVRSGFSELSAQLTDLKLTDKELVSRVEKNEDFIKSVKFSIKALWGSILAGIGAVLFGRFHS